MRQKWIFRFMPLLTLLYIGLSLSFFLLPAAAGTATKEVIPCNVNAYVVDNDPAGLNVRSGPGEQYPVIGTLPTNQDVEVSITSSSGAWMQIDEAYLFGEATVSEEGTKKISGWVYGPLLAVNTQNPNPVASNLVPLFSRPDTASPAAIALPPDTEVTLVGCRGAWIKARYKDIEGWLSPGSYCGNPVTTCP